MIFKKGTLGYKQSPMIENHRKSIFQNCERSELRLYF